MRGKLEGFDDECAWVRWEGGGGGGSMGGRGQVGLEMAKGDFGVGRRAQLGFGGTGPYAEAKEMPVSL